MTDEAKNRFDAWISVTTIVGSIIAFFFTICTWKEQNRMKRADFLEQKIIEFNDTSTFLARAVLDNFALCDTCNNRFSQVSDKEMVTIGSSRTGDTTDIQFSNIGKTLNEDHPSTNISKQRVRASFDHLLDFFGKLEYYLNLDLLTEEEIRYFDYYIRKCVGSEPIKQYAHDFNFDLFLSLINRKCLMTGK